jgi:hypothetical protein
MGSPEQKKSLTRCGFFLGRVGKLIPKKDLTKSVYMA